MKQQNFVTVPNQKIVQIAPRVQRNQMHLYATINLEALSEAVQKLNGAGLKMWLYFNQNQQDYQFALSRQACVEWGVKKDSYYNGVAELEAKGYLRPISEGSNIYQFYESPALYERMMAKKKIIAEAEKNFVGEKDIGKLERTF